MSTRKSARTAHAVAHCRRSQHHLRQTRNRIRKAGQSARRAALWALAGVVLMASLSACGGHAFLDNNPGTPDPAAGGWYGVADVNVHGKMVPCVTWKNGYAGGISCDFAGAK